MHHQTPIFLSTLLLSLLTIPLVSTQTFSSYQQWLDELPTCSRPCINSLYDEVLKSCGATRSSTSHADLVCLCKGGTISQSTQFDKGQKAGECAAKACDQAEDTQIVQDSLDFVTFCQNLVEGSDLGTSSAIGGVGVPTATFFSSTASTASPTSGTTATSGVASTTTTSASASAETGAGAASRPMSGALATMAVALMSILFAVSMA